MNLNNKSPNTPNNRNNSQQRKNVNKIPLNQYIYHKELRVINSDGEQLGVISKEEALKIAREQSLDLLVIADNQEPPIAKILDYGKYKFEQDKQKKENKKKSKTTVVKEFKMTPRIDTHDFQVKLRKIIEGINEGYKAKVIVQMKGRESQHPEFAKALLEKVLKEIESIAKSDLTPAIKREGSSFAIQISPL